MGNKGRPTPGTADEMRELTRELHEAEQGARQALAEYKAFHLKTKNDIIATLRAEMKEEFRKMLDEYREGIGKSIEKDIRDISAMFDGIVKKILGEDEFAKMAHLPGVKDALVAIRIHQFRGSGIADFSGLTDASLFEGMPENVRRQLMATTRASKNGANPETYAMGVKVRHHD